VLEPGDPIRVGGENVLFPAGEYRANSQHPQYDVAPDGQRFLMIKPREGSGMAPNARLFLIQNFFTEVEERVGGDR
jgi:hypothetical protein